MQEANTKLEWISKISPSKGLIFFGCADLALEKDAVRFEQWLSEEKNAGMAFLENHIEKRTNPKALFPGSQSALCFALPYEHQCEQKTISKSAMYACFKDYHHVIKKNIGEILSEVFEQDEEFINNNFKVCVDSVPLLERALLAKTSGFIGKNTCFIHTEHGSYLLLGVLLSKIKFKANEAKPVDHSIRSENGGCGTCSRCQTHCPTGALDEAYQLDARKCLSYWSIEHRGTVPQKYWKYFGEYYFGCDICQNVCPYNRHKKSRTHDFHRNTDISLKQIALMDQKEYVAWFSGTPMTRAKIFGLKRNAILAMYALSDPDLREVCDLSLIHI